MLISDEKNFLFYHVYKVAGTSIRDVLRPYCGYKQVVLQNIQYASSVLGVGLKLAPIYNFHPRLNDVAEYMGDDFFKYYRFSFVRHPLDWQKSLYYFMVKNPRHHQHELIKGMDFETYLKWRMDNELHLMSSLVTNSHGELLLDDVYKFENIDEEFSRLANRIGISANLPHKNQAGRGKVVDVSDAIMKEFKEAFSKDYAMFGYE